MTDESKKPLEEAEVAATDVIETPAETAKEEKAAAKAGKRSAKGIAEAAEKQAKEERKAHASEAKTEEAEQPKKAVKPARRPTISYGNLTRLLSDLLCPMETGHHPHPAMSI